MGSQPITLLKCENKGHWKLFERVPERLHRDDPSFVPPFPGSIVKLLVPPAPITRHGKVAGFIALRAGEAVGRIAAVENDAHRKYYSDHTGFFGFFDFIDDPTVSESLFDAAETQLRAWGCTNVRGPYQPTANDELGLLIHGFERPPFVMMPYNPAYYLKHYETLGLKKAVDLIAFHIDGSLQTPERILKIADRVKRSLGLKFRKVNMQNLDHDLAAICKLYNQTLDRNWGFVPLTFEELKFAANDLKQIVDPELVMIAEKDGEPVGYSMVIPNVNEMLEGTAKSPRWLRVLKFVWGLKTRRPREARLAALGVAPAYRGKGIETVFYAETLLKGGAKFRGGELSWVEESNEVIIRGIELMGARPYKKYRLFEKALAI